MKLTPFLIEELKHYREHNADCAEQSEEEGDAENALAFKLTADIFRDILEGKKPETDKEKEAVSEELNYLYDRYDGKELREWENLMAEFGALDVYNPNTQYMPAPICRTIGGVKYIVGRRR